MLGSSSGGAAVGSATSAPASSVASGAGPTLAPGTRLRSFTGTMCGCREGPGCAQSSVCTHLSSMHAFLPGGGLSSTGTHCRFHLRTWPAQSLASSLLRLMLRLDVMLLLLLRFYASTQQAASQWCRCWDGVLAQQQCCCCQPEAMRRSALYGATRVLVPTCCACRHSRCSNAELL
ncbi:hypothetical protein COO60DRAFT_1486943 [Scenedesmus sp. NREL 46B-D3]|nr:hypothetical protein COO60DRAFT_1486943 [Scenedesmus sp. NREL 46B-D3]